MRQQHVAQAAIVGRLVALQPENLRRGETREEGEAGLADRGLLAAELLRENRALGGRAGVTPQLGGADDIALLVERHEPVLLAGDADAAHAAAVDLRGDL